AAGLDVELTDTIGIMEMLQSGGLAIKVNGKSFDFVQVKMFAGGISMQSMRSSGLIKTTMRERRTVDVDYVVKPLGARNEKDVEAKLKKKTSGLFRKTLLDVEWQGGHLARTLNFDADLKRRIMESGTTNLEIKGDRRNDCIRIVHKKGLKIETVSESALGFPTQFRASVIEFPSREAIEICDKIAGYVKST
ncbi:MAG: hypothetical protein QMD16_17395, partial [Desulfitobacteriaceae bacterium]|nr:hypothetical protein [Desulfitobacteriaceae bacterium]